MTGKYSSTGIKYCILGKEDIEKPGPKPAYRPSIYDPEKKYILIPATGSLYLVGPKDLSNEEILNNWPTYLHRPYK